MNRFHFTSVVSQDHLFKFLAMYSSLKAHCSDFKLFAICASDIVWHILNKAAFSEIVPVYLHDIENEAILKAKEDRPFHAFCWTLKPVFLHYVMNKYPDCQYFAHLDADLYFFENPGLIFLENPEASLFLTHHRNARNFLEYYGRTGVFNTGFVGCKNNATALKAIAQWKEQCLLFCPIQEDPIRKLFGDQRYVESWPDQFHGVHVVRSTGANAALWNIQNYTVTAKEGKVYLNNDPLIFYHFSGLTIISRTEFNLNWYYHIDDPMVLDHIYMPYVYTLSNTMKEMNVNFPWFISGLLKKEITPDTHYFSFN